MIGVDIGHAERRISETGRPRDEPTAREVLGAAIGAHAGAVADHAAALEASERAALVVGGRQAALDQFSDLDARCAALTAAAIRTGGDRIALPEELVAERVARHVALEGLADMEAAAELLTGEVQRCLSGVENAAVAVRVAVVAVMKLDAESVNTTRAAAEREAAELRQHCCAYSMIWSQQDQAHTPVPWAIGSLAFDPLHGLLLDTLGRPGGAVAGEGAAVQAWMDYRGRLATDAKAQLTVKKKEPCDTDQS